jgi:hypothetical protein
MLAKSYTICTRSEMKKDFHFARSLDGKHRKTKANHMINRLITSLISSS